MVKRVFILVLMLALLIVPVHAKASVDKMTDENTYIDEAGNIFTYQNDKVYQLIDGQLYEYVNGNSQSIMDVFKNKPGSERPDSEVMGRTNDFISKTIGVALSVIIYVFFAMTAFTTACDLAYIGVPAVRPLMYEQGGSWAVAHGQGQVQGSSETKSRCLISSELRSIMNIGQGNAQTVIPSSNIMVTYLKRRAISIVIIVAVFMLLVTSSVFTDFGLNIGSMLYQTAAKFFGF